jgi:UDP-N-acetylmuramoylalanine--D-glutamate ligase
MNIAILGYNLEGQSSYDYFVGQGHTITIRDSNAGLKVPDGVTSVLGEPYLDNLDEFDLIVRTAGLAPSLILDQNPGVGDKITTHINEFLKACPTPNVIGVTGTKGKGTTSTLIAKMLEAAGHDVKLGGNIGLPPLTFLKELTADSWVILELSSFQLIDLKLSPHIAICLMVVPEHLNWHMDMREYVEAKSQLFKHQSERDIAVYFAGNEISRQIAHAGPAQKIPYFDPPGATAEDGVISIGHQVICKTYELKLLGRHNWQNVCAAVTAVWQVSQDVDAIRSVLTSFSGLEHRLEFVRELRGVRYYDDSFGTTPETAMAAIEAFQQPEVLILGGQAKGIGFDDLAKNIKNNEYIAKVLVIGEARPELVTALNTAGYTDYVTTDARTMPEIIKTAAELGEKTAAERGETATVLLSTACTSFDMFDNYKQRGDKFKQAVRELV